MALHVPRILSVRYGQIPKSKNSKEGEKRIKYRSMLVRE